ncbi:hypothetical protein BC629DRAFT_1514403 [Irpex lacteus]|nr:hypothetical protein BC629DRAFT_1514403 [Irpex lacteus]
MHAKLPPSPLLFSRPVDLPSPSPTRPYGSEVHVQITSSALGVPTICRLHSRHISHAKATRALATTANVFSPCRPASSLNSCPRYANARNGHILRLGRTYAPPLRFIRYLSYGRYLLALPLTTTLVSSRHCLASLLPELWHPVLSCTYGRHLRLGRKHA